MYQGLPDPEAPTWRDRIARSSSSWGALQSLVPGQQVGAFQITEVLAEGGQGAVYKAVHLPTGQYVALKLALDLDDASRGRFVQEAEVLARLEHRNVVQALEHGYWQGIPYLVLEMVEGHSLEDHVRHYGLPKPGWIGEILGPIAEALAYVHAAGLVHRDLKPQNVLIESGSRRPVLVDFGLVQRDASAMQLGGELDRQRLSVTGELKGTPGYMPPEQVAGERVGPAADVYGLGALLFFLLTGQPPFQGATHLNTLQQVLRSAPPDPRGHRPRASTRLSELAMRCLAKSPDERPATAAAFAHELRQALPRRRRALVRLAAALASLLLLVSAVGAVLILEPHRTEWGWGSPADATPAPQSAPGSPTVSVSEGVEAELADVAVVLSWLVAKDYGRAEREIDRALTQRLSADWLWLRGTLNAERDRPLDTEADFVAALAVEPGHARSALDLARLWSEHHRWGLVQDLCHSLESGGHPVEPLVRATLFDRQGKFAQAARAFDEGLKLDPENNSARSDRAALLIDMARFEEALRDIERIEARQALTPNQVHVRAMALAGLGSMEESLRLLEQDCLQRQPGDPVFLSGLALVSLQVGEYPAADRWTEELVRVAPDYPQLPILRQERQVAASLDLALQQAVQATRRQNVQAFARLAPSLVRLTRFRRQPPPGTPAQWLTLSKAFGALRKYPYQASAARIGLRLAPSSGNLYEQLASAEMLQGNSAAALAALDRAVAVAPGEGRHYASRAVVLEALGRHEEAERDFARAWELGNRVPAVLARRSLSVVDDDPQEALGLAQQAYQRAAASVPVLYAYASALVHCGRPTEALAIADRLVQVRPGEASGYFARAQAYERLGDRPLALRDYQAALDRWPPESGQAGIARRRLAALQAGE